MSPSRGIYFLLFALLTGCAGKPVIQAEKLGDLPPEPKRIVVITNISGDNSRRYAPLLDGFERTIQQCGVEIRTSRIEPLALNNDDQKNLITELKPDLVLDLGLKHASIYGSSCYQEFSIKAWTPQQRSAIWSAKLSQRDRCWWPETLQSIADELARKLHEDGLLASCPTLANTGKPKS